MLLLLQAQITPMWTLRTRSIILLRTIITRLTLLWWISEVRVGRRRLMLVMLVFWWDVVISRRHGTCKITHHTRMRTGLAVHIGNLRDGWDNIGLTGHVRGGRAGCFLAFGRWESFLRSLRDGSTVTDGSSGFCLGLCMVVGWTGLSCCMSRCGHGSRGSGGEFVRSDRQATILSFGRWDWAGKGLTVGSEAIRSAEAGLRGSCQVTSSSISISGRRECDLIAHLNQIFPFRLLHQRL